MYGLSLSSQDDLSGSHPTCPRMLRDDGGSSGERFLSLSEWKGVLTHSWKQSTGFWGRRELEKPPQSSEMNLPRILNTHECFYLNGLAKARWILAEASLKFLKQRTSGQSPLCPIGGTVKIHGEGEGGEGEGQVKRINACYAHGPPYHDECNHYAQQTCAYKIF